jgi:protein SCO1
MNNKRLLLKALGGTTLIPAVASASTSNRSTPSKASSYFPNLELVTHEGKKVKFYDDLLKDKLVIFNMMYTVCTRTCPISTASLLNVQEALGSRVGRDIFMYSLTLQPELDTPEALRDYMKKYGVRPGWTYLTGKRDDTEIVRRKLGFYNSDPVADADITKHTGMVRIGYGTRNKWFMTPAISSTKQIVHAILNV